MLPIVALVTVFVGYWFEMYIWLCLPIVLVCVYFLERRMRGKHKARTSPSNNLPVRS